MRNRAKCKLCQTVIESFHAYDYVECKCGEIAVDGGEALKVSAKDFSNLLRVDDLGNEIIVQVEDVIKHNNSNVNKPNREELLKMLEEMINNIQNLPQAAMVNPINHYDFCSALLLILATLRSDS